MNASVRNAVFFPAFFLTPIALAITGVLAWRVVRRRAAGLFLGAAAVYLVGGLILTMAINVSDPRRCRPRCACRRQTESDYRISVTA